MDKNQLIEEIKVAMVSEIQNAVRKVRLEKSDKVCYISLYGSNDEPVLSLITLGIKSYRDKMLREEHSQILWYIWNSGEMPACYQVGLESVLPSFSEKQEEFISLFGEEEWKGLWELCQSTRFDVAFQLNQKNWDNIIPVTDDFVVYSDWDDIDVENGDLMRSIPDEKIKLLKEKGLL
jgi:hypothetical protein